MIVVPRLLRDTLMVWLAHGGHQGIDKTKYRLRSEVWLPRMDKDVEKFCRVCHGCQVTSGFEPTEPTSRGFPPRAPWQDFGTDLLGPLPTGESILAVVDYYSGFLETKTEITPCCMIFGRETRSKLPELKRETVGVPGEEVRERDWSSKLKDKAYADLKGGATPKSIRVGDTVLVKAEKTNVLTTNFNPDPFKVVHKTRSEVTLRNEAGIELKRNTVFVKKYNEHRDVSNGNDDQVVQAGSAVQVDEAGASKIPETTVVPMPKEIPGMSKTD
ncbi:Uncharacterized protein K02A2.6 [Stylophora pistillata]|uniref:Uncharacterized protein K02A2.6 n=1 Tax=Stylophora pistillata TaxID=50429 RepID=A0A2B4SG99_STYPI|nr:Uncharacterized protein K02A2.6 [Stylophora pistillata]